MDRSLALGTVLLCAVLAAPSASAQVRKSSQSRIVATLSSDQPDYGPDEIAVLTGAGFVPQEVVTVQVVHADGSPSSGQDHDPWTVKASIDGRFVTHWHVCTDDCVGQLLRATAIGASSGKRATTVFSDSNNCGTGIVVSVDPVGGSCVAFTPAVGAGPDNYEVAEGATYTMTIDGVTECSGDTITVFVQTAARATSASTPRAAVASTPAPSPCRARPATPCR